MDFEKWLINKKNYSIRSASDVTSRIKRAKNILGIENINNNTESDLNNSKDFSFLSCSVKSQIRVAIRLYLEYKKGEKHD